MDNHQRVEIVITISGGGVEVSQNVQMEDCDKKFLEKRLRTLPEVLEYFEWDRSRAETLRNRVREGKIKGRKLDGTWMVETRSAFEYLNQPCPDRDN